MATIKAGIVGYGNLGKSVEAVIKQTSDIELVGVFSRRDSLDTDATVIPVADVAEYADKIDVLYLCLGSATDIPEQAPEFAKYACTVDTYDNHRDVARHYSAMQDVAEKAGNVAVVSTGWDPGMFSLNRVYAAAILPDAQQNTFWGPGLSQGHSDALRRIEGVTSAVQYTLPAEEALDKARRGEAEGITGKNAHKRQCFVVPESDDAELKERIENDIRTMPDYFVGYEVEVNFISQEEFDKNHTGMPHGGHVITTGELGATRTHHTVEFTLELDRNPDFTAAVQVAYGRAAHRLKESGQSGAFTVLEIAPYLLSEKPLEDMLREDV